MQCEHVSSCPESLGGSNGVRSAGQGTDEGALDYGLNRALDAYYNNRAWFNSLAARIMRQDWSWNRPAIDYIDLCVLTPVIYLFSGFL